MNMKSSLCVYPYQSFTYEQMILSLKMKLSPGVYHYQLLKKEQMILLMNMKLLPCVHPKGSLQNKNKKSVEKIVFFVLLSVFDPFYRKISGNFPYFSEVGPGGVEKIHTFFF